MVPVSVFYPHFLIYVREGKGKIKCPHFDIILCKLGLRILRRENLKKYLFEVSLVHMLLSFTVNHVLPSWPV